MAHGVSPLWIFQAENSPARRMMPCASSLSAAHARRIEGSPSSAISLRTWSQADLIIPSSVAHVGVALFVFIALGFVVCDLFTTFAASSGKPGKGRARQRLFNALATLWNYALTSIVKRIFQILIISLTDIIRKICRGFSYSLLPVSDSWLLPIVESFFVCVTRRCSRVHIL